MSSTTASARLDRPRLWLRYLVVGGAATAAHWALMAWLVERQALPAWWASGAGAVLGAQVAFFANRRFTFDHHGPAWPAWWRFMGTAAMGGVLGMLIVATGVWLGWHYLLVQALATGLVLLLTFAVNRAWTFGR
jgi:putative flippase GtrA